MESLLGSLQGIPRRTGLSSGMVGVLLGISILCLGGFLFSYTLSIDDELTVIRQNESILFHFQVGRFALGLLRKSFWPSTHPLIAYASLAMAYVAAYVLLLGIHNLRHSWTTILTFIIFIGFPTNWLLQEFPVTAFSLAFGLVLAPIAAIETLRVHHANSAGRQRRRHLSWVTIALLVLMIGYLQSFILLYLSIGIGWLVLDGDAVPAESDKDLRTLPWFFGYGAIAIILLQLINKLSLAILGLEPAHLDNYTRNTLGMLRFKPLEYVLGHATQIALSYLHPSHSYGAELWALPILIGGSLLTYALSRKRATPRTRLLQAGLLLLLLISPFLLNALSTPNRLPLRSYVSFPYVVWVFAMLWLVHARNLRPRAFTASALTTGLLAFQCLSTSSEYYFARQYNSRADLVTASALASALLNREEFSGHGQLQLVVHGELKRQPLSRSAWYSSANGSFFNWDGGNPVRIVSYLRTLGIDNLNVANETTEARVRDQFRSMRSWPDPQSLRLEGDVLLLKLSEEAPASSGH